MKSVAVITPTIGKETLKECVQSVQNQTYKNITHHIVVDGNKHWCKTLDILEYIKTKNLALTDLSENVGADGFYGHRVYAAWSFLVNQDYVMFLDEDNWLEPTHVETCIKTLETLGADWCFSYRNIHDVDGTFVCKDECESLGDFHIDTSCFFLKREVAVRSGHAWYGKWGQDRVFFGFLKHYFRGYVPTNHYTMNYRLGGNPGSVTKEFFLKGNEMVKQQHKNVI